MIEYDLIIRRNGDWESQTQNFTFRVSRRESTNGDTISSRNRTGTVEFFPPESVAAYCGVTFATGFPAESFNVMVTTEFATPSAVTGPAPEIVEVVPSTVFSIELSSDLLDFWHCN